jgi:hypothetical protein
MEIDSENLKDLLALHKVIDEASERPGCLDTDPEIFFAEKPQNYEDARSVCMKCPVITECAVYAIKWEHDGYFGGLTPRQRMKMRAMANARKRAA